MIRICEAHGSYNGAYRPTCLRRATVADAGRVRLCGMAPAVEGTLSEPWAISPASGFTSPTDRAENGVAQRFVPTRADIRDMAVALLAAEDSISFAQATAAFQPSRDKRHFKMECLAEAVFDHAGYIPSIAAARRDHADRIRTLESELATLRDRLRRISAISGER